MESINLIESFADFAGQKNIDRPTMIRILEDVFRTMIRKKYETDDNFDIIINADKGDLEIWRFREIVDDNSEDICAMTKAKLGSVAKLASQEGVQMHGGVGMTDEYDIGLFMKRIRVLQELFGDASYHMNKVAISNEY